MKKLPVKHHTPAERMELRRRKRKHGPAAQRRAEGRLKLQPRKKEPEPEMPLIPEIGK
ncbi:MAG TPA: hypothetical protein VM531_11320 [Sphingomicrobium sp.]|jgi:hypothetical protein|nr:hypothetical protein [Sphingomicrobium sp.]